MASIHNTVISAHYARILTVMHLDLSRSLTIVDPFDFDTSRSSNTRNNGALLNCFSEKYSEWLPSPNINDVIILRGAKVRLIDLPCTTIHIRLVHHFQISAHILGIMRPIHQ